MGTSEDRSPSVMINKCWNVIKGICSNKNFLQQLPAFEQELLSLYDLMQDPSKICFDDEIVQCMDSFIRKQQQVSPVQWTLFTTFPKVLTKNKDSFGNLLNTLNLFLKYGKQRLI